MSTKNYKKNSEEFKIDAVKLVIEQGYSIAEAAKSLGVARSTLGSWKREYESKNNVSVESAKQPEVLEELRRLKKENKRLKMEREILKKAAAFFAKETE